jgi:hypothetical protein
MYNSEIPDAIGWKVSSSILIEVKVSRSDFHAQKRKRHVRLNSGMGQKRYYLVPSKLITLEDLREMGENGETIESDYGLLWATEHQIRVIKEPTFRDGYDKDSEMVMLVSALRRVRAREFLILVPDGQIGEDTTLNEENQQSED